MQIHMVQCHYGSEVGCWTNDIRPFREKADAEAFAEYLGTAVMEFHGKLVKLSEERSKHYQERARRRNSDAEATERAIVAIQALDAAWDALVSETNEMVRKDLNWPEFEIVDFNEQESFSVETFEVY